MKVLFKNAKLEFKKYQHVNFTDSDIVNQGLLELYVNDDTDMSVVKAITVVNCTPVSSSYRYGINFYDSNGQNLDYHATFVGNLPDCRSKNKAVMAFDHGYFVLDATAIVAEGEGSDRLSVNTWSNYTDLDNSPKIKEYLSNQ